MFKIENIKNTVILGDFLMNIKKIENNEIDLILIDPPFGKIQGMKLSGQERTIDWDVKIDWKLMFKEFNRIIKPGGTILVFGQQPTYSEMIQSNIKYYKYEYIWEKNNAAQGFHADKMPLITSENIAAFIVDESKEFKRTYNKPSATKEIDKTIHFTRWYAYKVFKYINKTRREIHRDMGHRKLEFFFYVTGNQFGLLSNDLYDDLIKKYNINNMPGFLEYDELKKIWKAELKKSKNIKLDSSKVIGTFSNILKFKKDYKPYFHPTQKPISLLKKLIEVHSNEGDIVLDCFAGSGSTLIAAKKLDRSYIGIELDEKYYEIIKKRINELK